MMDLRSNLIQNSNIHKSDQLHSVCDDAKKYSYVMSLELKKTHKNISYEGGRKNVCKKGQALKKAP